MGRGYGRKEGLWQHMGWSAAALPAVNTRHCVLRLPPAHAQRTQHCPLAAAVVVLGPGPRQRPMYTPPTHAAGHAARHHAARPRTCTDTLPRRARASAMSTVQSRPTTSTPVALIRSSRPPLPLAYSVSGVRGWVALTCGGAGGAGSGQAGGELERGQACHACSKLVMPLVLLPPLLLHAAPPSRRGKGGQGGGGNAAAAPHAPPPFLPSVPPAARCAQCRGATSGPTGVAAAARPSCQTSSRSRRRCG